MKPYKIAFLFILIPPAQTLLKHLIGAEAAYYDFFMVLIIYLSIMLNMVASIYLASLAGIIKDMLSAPVIGLNGFSFPLIALTSNFIFSKFPIRKFYSQFMIVFVLTIINNQIISLITLIFGIKILNPSFFNNLYMGLANGILFIFIYNVKKLIPGKQIKKSSKYAL
jgi:rod shape-determining protein MreD